MAFDLDLDKAAAVDIEAEVGGWATRTQPGVGGTGSVTGWPGRKALSGQHRAVVRAGFLRKSGK